MTTPTTRLPPDRELVDRLKAGDEAAFALLIDSFSPSLLRLARMYVRTQADAEEVVQETWLGVLKGIDRFEGRSALRTWIYRILTNTAKTRGTREARSVPFSAAFEAGSDPSEPAVDPERFLSPRPDSPVGEWALAPRPWPTPEESLLAGEAQRTTLAAIDELPPAQREVVTLRDVEGWSSAEVCNTLGITDTNQRVLLHRGRSKVRTALESYFGAAEGER